MTQLVLVVLLIIYNAYYIQGQCRQEWMDSILKAIGLQIVSILLMASVAAILDYWDTSERKRALMSNQEFKGTLAGDIANKVLNPQRVSGLFIHLALSYGLFWFFTRKCNI